MDKNAIKKYAVWARTELITRVSQRAEKYDITAEADVNASSVNGVLLSDSEKKQRKALIEQVKQKGYEQVMEEVAYTWFNRFIALRFMEVNGYLPSHIRVFTDDNNEFKPQILSEAIHLELDGLDMEKVYEMKNNNENDELYKYLIITQCNDLSKILPGMFQKISDYTELLFPENVLREGSVIEQMVSLIPEDNWNVHTIEEDGVEQGQVQIIGWLYQYYNLEPNEVVYDGSMSKSRVPKELLPAATTIYTPDWAVHYMIENSLGKLWLDSHPNDTLKDLWKYVLPGSKQNDETALKINHLIELTKNIKPEDIKCLDPCSGSGHICVYMFDVLIQIYEAYGYTAREAASLIVKNNIFGLDIDDRAAQLANFSVTMKALQYDRLFLSRGIYPNVYSIKESNSLDPFLVDYFAKGNEKVKSNISILLDEMKDAKEYGSILKTNKVDFDILFNRLDEAEKEISMYSDVIQSQLRPFISSAYLLHQKYQIVVTNPPYLGSSRFSAKLDKYTKKYYPDEKSDLSMIMFRKALDDYVEEGGFVSFITTSSWMFLSSFERMRNYLLKNNSITSIVDFGTELFEGKVGHNPIVSWVCRKIQTNYKLTAVRLVDYCYSRRDKKKDEYFNDRNRYYTLQDNFFKIPGAPLAYWLSDNIYDVYSEGQLFENIGHPKVGMQTSNNDKYLRLWFEINYTEFKDNSKGIKWIKYLKGGAYRKWYGNLDYLLFYNYSPDYILQQKNARVLDLSFLEKKKCTWTDLTSGRNSFRIAPDDTFHDISGHCFYPNAEDQYWLLGYANTNVFTMLLKVFNSTFHCQVGDVAKVAVPCMTKQEKERVAQLAKENVEIAKADWDSFETSWDFVRHPLIQSGMKLEQAFKNWSNKCEERIEIVRKNEEELNSIFIKKFNLENELSPCITDEEITINRSDLVKNVKGLISYAVGCIMGRYSLDIDGIAFAGGEWDTSKYITIPADVDGIVPICDDEYFEDDLTGLFIKFIDTVYGHAYLENNLDFIARAIGGKGSSRDIIRNYFLNSFYGDHCSMYSVSVSGKRPIYWLFESGKKNGFKCLVYMHRYKADTIARIRTDYVHEQQSRYRTAIEETENRLLSASGSDKVKLDKKLKKLKDQDVEIHTYEEKIHHLADQMISINLDDGVKVNYAKFQDVLAKIK